MSGKITPSVWKGIVNKYQKSNKWKGIWQLINSFVPFVITWYLMFLSLNVNYVITLLLAFPAAGFLVRLFIIQHDCGHGSFFTSKKANDYGGMFCSIFTLTPYHYWRKSHAIHHASAGNLEHRGIGDISTLTISEYLKLSRWGKIKYRIYRNPFVLFLIAPTILFTIVYRFPASSSKAVKNLQRSVYVTSFILLALVSLLIFLIGFKSFFMIQIPITIISSSTGAWLFFVQHQFENTYWEKDESWDYTQAALQGSSYYKLPKVLQWFTGNIGFHHIHHLSPRIPNYHLEKCHKENQLFQKAVILTFRSSLKSMMLSLWDEKHKKLVGFRYLKKYKLNTQ